MPTSTGVTEMAHEPTKGELEIDALLGKMDDDLGKIERRSKSGKMVRPTTVMSARQLKRTRMVLQTISQAELDMDCEEAEEDPPHKVNGKINGAT